MTGMQLRSLFMSVYSYGSGCQVVLFSSMQMSPQLIQLVSDYLFQTRDLSPTPITPNPRHNEVVS